MEIYLNQNNFKHIRVSGVSPDQLTLDNEYMIRLDNNTKTLIACTTSHLDALYQAFNLYKLKSENYYYLVLEDDVRLSYNFNWTKLIESAPSEWSMLQITTSNPNMINYLKEQWIASNGTLLWKLRNNAAWAAGAYVINTRKIGNVFDKATLTESISTMNRFNTMNTFMQRCNKTDTSIAARCRCQGGILYYADKYIYRLSDKSSSYISTIPLANFLPKVKSEISTGHSKIQTKASNEINKIYMLTKTVYQHILPSYILS